MENVYGRRPGLPAIEIPETSEQLHYLKRIRAHTHIYPEHSVV